MKKYSLVPEDISSGIKSNALKIIITFILVVLFLFFPKVGFSPLGEGDFGLWKNIVFPFCHANAFHLFCNLYCLWLMRKPLYIIQGFIISFLCSFLPEMSLYDIITFLPLKGVGGSVGVLGFSGILFAIIGIKWGMVAQWKQMWRKCWLFFLITAFIPNVAFLFHIYCIIVGYLYGYIISTIDLWRKTRICL